jgi:hypothetical protein
MAMFCALLFELGLQQEGIGSRDPLTGLEPGEDRHHSGRPAADLDLPSLKSASCPHEDNIASFEHLHSIFGYRDTALVQFARGANTRLKERSGLQTGNGARQGKNRCRATALGIERRRYRPDASADLPSIAEDQRSLVARLDA